MGCQSSTQLKGILEPSPKEGSPPSSSSPCSSGTISQDFLVESKTFALLASPKNETPTEQRGVSLQFLLHLLDGGKFLRFWSTAEAVQMFVRPTTSSHQCSLYDLVPAAMCGPPKYFISHAWSQTLEELLVVLKQHFGVASAEDPASANIMLWIDVVAINQNGRGMNDSPRAAKRTSRTSKGQVLPEGQNPLDILSHVIKSTEQTVLCLDKKCSALNRLWCLYEVLRTAELRGERSLVVAMPWIMPHMSLRHAFEALDIGSAGCSLQVDKQRIMTALDSQQASGTLNELNARIKGLLARSAESEQDLLPAEESYSMENCVKSARLLLANGQMHDALPLLEKALGRLKTPERTCGASVAQASSCGKDSCSRSTTDLVTTSELAFCLTDMGRQEAALPLYQQAAIESERVFGASHRHTISTTSELALCLYQIGRYEEALVLFRAVMKEAAGAGDEEMGNSAELSDVFEKMPVTLWSVLQTAHCLSNLQRHEEALQLFHKAAAGFDESKPNTVQALISLASCLQQMERLQEALTLWLRAMDKSYNLLGGNDPKSIAATNGTASCLMALGRYQDAWPLYEKQEKCIQATMGAEASEAFGCANNMGECLRCMGRFEEAASIFDAALKGQQRTLGATHLDTLTTLSNYASCLFSLGRHAEALPMFQQVLEEREALLGADHRDVIESAMSLGACLRTTGDVDAAKPVLTRAYQGFLKLNGPGHPDTKIAESWLAAA